MLNLTVMRVTTATPPAFEGPKAEVWVSHQDVNASEAQPSARNWNANVWNVLGSHRLMGLRNLLLLAVLYHIPAHGIPNWPYIGYRTHSANGEFRMSVLVCA